MKKRKQVLHTLLIFSLPTVLCICFLFVNPALSLDLGQIASNIIELVNAVVFDNTFQQSPLNDSPSNSENYYLITPSTLLEDIGNDQKNIFRLVEDEDVVLPVKNPSGSFPWSSEQYFSVAKAHHLYLTNEPAESEWKIFAFGYFDINKCENELKGFDSATIVFYKEKLSSFPVTYMTIEPLREVIGSASLDYQREKQRSLFAKFLDNPDDSFKEAIAVRELSAEEALQIAENAGGEDMRQRMMDEGCSIQMAYYVDKWVVWYRWQTKDLNFALIFDINSNDGSYKIRQELKKCERTLCP